MAELCTDLGDAFPRTPQQMRELRAAGVAASKRMLAFIDASPTPFHAAANVARQLREEGFVELDERAPWALAPGARHYVVRDGSTLVAFVVGRRAPAEAGYRIVGAHTDSPNLRVRPRPDVAHKGYLQVAVEVYGGVLLHTWLDRDLSIAGRVLARGRDGRVEPVLVDLRRPVARVPALAIHLNRKVNTDGLLLNAQKHLVPLVGVGDRLDLAREVAEAAGVEPATIASFDLSFYDVQKGAIGGLDESLVSSARLDNLASCFAATEALCAAGEALDATAVMVLYDHEEVGSQSAVGAGGTVLRDVLERIALAYPDGQLQAFARALAGSLCVSADMAHALHPNYPDKHEEEHAPLLNHGLVLKTNVNQSYATTGTSAAFFAGLCREVGFAPQHFVARNDMPCGSTIGPITSARLGVRTVDVGAPMLAMHSCRETAGTLDAHLAIQTYTLLFR
jgi:aspartyl aminopeptidase